MLNCPDFKCGFVLFILFLGIATKVDSQERFDIPVKLNNAELSMPWTGGMNAPQFANIDFNRDGITDLISFDRQGDVLIPYIHLPASGRWIVDWSYKSIFPKLVDWVQVVDYNNDGVEDLFTSSSATGVAGIMVYKGVYENDQWSFVLQPDRGKLYLQISVQSSLTNLYVSWDDIPAIRDIDGDGDIDVLSFEPGGSYINYYRNTSVENGLSLDSLRYEIGDLCWGKILENELNQEVYLSDDPDVCSDGHFGEVPVVTRHSGSTLMAYDPDYDLDQDVWVGDISSRHIVFLVNGLHPEEAWITSQDPAFPSYDTIVDLPYFPATFSVQLDDDPEPEFLAAVSSRGLSEDRKSVWRYDDDVAGGPIHYLFSEKGFFQNNMIEVGSQTKPAVADINGDGKKDLLMGGYHYTDGAATRIPSLWYFQNIGTMQQPYFEFVTDDYLNMSQYGTFPTFDFSPAFGDIDGNGSVDLIVGEQNGKLFFYKNLAAAGAPVNFAAPEYPYMNISVGVSSTPQIVDINGDGLSDLIIGERTGNADINGRCSNLNYFQNLGTASNAIFNPDVNALPNTGCFGRVLFDIAAGLPQYSTPFIGNTSEGLRLMTGNDRGNLLLFGDLDQGIMGSLTLIDDHYGNIDAGNRSAPALADFDDDGKFELIVGNQRGGLELFHTEIQEGTTAVIQPQAGPEKPYQIMQSSDKALIEIVWKNNLSGEVKLFDAYGRSIDISQTQNNIIQEINLGSYPHAIYFIRIQVGQQVWIEKVFN
jgi:hypothetical protein